MYYKANHRAVTSYSSCEESVELPNRQQVDFLMLGNKTKEQLTN